MGVGFATPGQFKMQLLMALIPSGRKRKIYKMCKNNAYNEDNMKEAVEPAKKAVAVL
jgi:hypothetical protein